MEYRAENYHLFMLDFCYFMNVSVLMQTILFPNCLVWFKANYALCMGVLMMAILVWQNSLVFHSLDKLTSFFLHFFPPLHLHLFRCTKPSLYPLIYLYLFFIFISSSAPNYLFACSLIFTFSLSLFLPVHPTIRLPSLPPKNCSSSVGD